MSNRIDTVTKLGTQVLYFLSGNVYTLIVGLSLQIYIARVLGAENLGIFSLMEAGVGLIVGILGFGIAPTLVKYLPFHLEKKEYNSARQLLKVCFAILFIAGILAYGLVAILLPYIQLNWPELNPYSTEIIFMALLIPLSLISFYLQQGLRGFQEFRHMMIGSVFLQLTLKVIFVIVFFSLGFKLIGYVWAVVCAAFIAILWLAYGLKKKLNSMPKPPTSDGDNKFPEWRKYATIMYSSNILSNSTSYADRFFLGYFANASSVGVYAVVNQLNQLPLVFLQLLLSVAAPMFSAAHAKNDKSEIQHIYHLTTDWVTRAAFPLIIFLLVFADQILGLYGEEFANNGVTALWIMVLGQFVNLLCGPIGILMNMTGHEKVLLKFTVYQTLLMLMCLMLLVPMYGLIGVAISMAGTLILLNIAVIVFAKRKVDFRWSDARYNKWISSMAACAIVALLLKNFVVEDSLWLLGLSLVALYAVFHLTSYVQGFHQEDIQLYQHIKQKLLAR